MTTTNGGTWEDGKCLCPDGFQGDFCEEVICQNGGTFANGVCQCPPNFQGDRCQTAKDVVEIQNVTMNATVEMTAKVDNRNFSEDLKNPSSDAYKEFNDTFQKQVRFGPEPSTAPSPRSSGSIVVDYDVILELPATSPLSMPGVCFNSNFTVVHKVEVQEVEERKFGCLGVSNPSGEPQNLRSASPPSGVCDSYIQEEFRVFYTPYLTKVGVICITRCDSRHADPLPCVHGRCSVSRAGPQCECSDKVAFWYQDNACSSRISKVGVSVGVPVAVLVLVISSLWVPPRRKKLRSRSEMYTSDDGNWDGSQGFAMGNLAATWEGNGRGGGDGRGDGLEVAVAPRGPWHLFFHPTDMETPNTSYINLENVDTSRTVGDTSPGA
uniref:EGF-like domain-containing protein n=1 Tax=Taeniopygia guttata TaxID=59729 RepID=A0A674HNC5_TAEGU